MTIQQDHRLLAILPDDVPKTKGVYDVKALHGCLRDAINATLISSDQEAARHKCLYDHRAGVVELCPGDSFTMPGLKSEGKCII